MLALIGGLFMALTVALLLSGCNQEPIKAAAPRFVTEYGLGPDKWATAWLLTRRIAPQSTLTIVGPGEALPLGVQFDLPSADIRRINNRSAFEVAKATLSTEDPALEAFASIVHEIEINFWMGGGPPQAQSVEEAYRALQYRYGRDAVTPACYVAFFDRVYQVLRDEQENSLPLTPERLRMSCEELEHLAEHRSDLIPEIPIIDVLNAAAAGRKVVFVDVRETDEFIEGHIPGALNIPIRDVDPAFRERFSDADYVVSYCVKDFRGFEMAKALANVGVANSVIMRPYGIKGWVALGLPISGSKALGEAQARQALDACLQDADACLKRLNRST